MTRMHRGFHDGDRIVRVLYSELYLYPSIYISGGWLGVRMGFKALLCCLVLFFLFYFYLLSFYFLLLILLFLIFFFF